MIATLDKSKAIDGTNRGRPTKWESPQQLEKLANKYIDECKANDIPLTITGLAYA